MSKFKRISVILLVGMLVCGSGVLAEDNEVNQAGTQNVELHASVSSTYKVLLPKSVDVTAEETTFEIKCSGDIAADETLTVDVTTDGIQLIEQVSQGATAHDPIDLVITTEKESFSFDDLTDTYVDDGPGTSTVTISHGKIYAGTWKVDLPISISLS